MSWSTGGPSNGNDTFTGGPNGDSPAGAQNGNDSLVGNGGNDSLRGEGNNDTIRGGEGNDTLLGGNGSDWLFGDAGNDSLVGDGQSGGGSPSDTMDGGSGNDTIVAGSSNDSVLGGDGNDSLVLAGGNDTGLGGAGNDTIDGGSGNDILDGGADNDRLIGGSGNDSIFGGTSADSLDGGSGDDTLQGGAGADTFVDSGGVDELSYASDTVGVTVNMQLGTASGGDAQGDVFAGNTFENLRGGSGNDFLTGSTHYDNIIYGEGGNDTIVTNLGDTAYGGAGDDSIYGSPESGSGNEDVLFGDDGNDIIVARGGTDTVFGGAGDDTVIAGNGDGIDSLDGGSGNDTLLLRNWAGPNINTDDIASGVWGNWTVSGATGPDALRTFTYSDGTVLRVRDFEAIVCFTEGTLITTPRGEVPVEALRAGDQVLTLHDGPVIRPLVWTGRTSVDVARHPDRVKVAPVRITAGALGDGVPFRDLVVSPDHGILLDGHLVPAGLLVNGTTILRETWHRRVTYYHLEIEGHGLLVSEGAVTETYLDDGNRHLFDNAALATVAVDFAAYRGNGRYAAAACAPLLTEGDLPLTAIRARLAGRAAAAGPRRSARG